MLLTPARSAMPMGEGPNDARPVAAPHRSRPARRACAELGTRPHRPLPGARVGRPDAARGDARGARRARPRGQGPLHRLLQLFRLASHEGARHRRARRQLALRQPADLLLAAGARRRVRAGPDRRSTRASASWSGARWPAACCPASTAAASRCRSGRHLSDWGEPPIHDEKKLYDTIEVLVADRRGARACRRRRSRSPGRSAGRAITSLVIGARNEEQLKHEPALRRPEADAGGARQARRGQRAHPALPILAPGQHRTRPPRRLRTWLLLAPVREGRGAVLTRREHALYSVMAGLVLPSTVSMGGNFAAAGGLVDPMAKPWDDKWA